MDIKCLLGRIHGGASFQVSSPGPVDIHPHPSPNFSQCRGNNYKLLLGEVAEPDVAEHGLLNLVISKNHCMKINVENLKMKVDT